MRKLAAVLVAPMLLLSACAAQSTAGAPAPAADGRSATGLGVPGFGGAEDAAKAEGAPAAAPRPGSNQSIPTVVINADRNLILTAKIDMRSKDPWATSDRAQTIATSLGGDVLNSSQTGSGDSRSATLVMRVPSTRFSDALRQLKELDGEVATSGVSAQDVTDQFVDLEARLSAKKAEEQRYLAILTRANTIDEILKVDAALANVRLQIEQLTGQLNSIKSRTEFSTISMSISMLSVLPGDTTSKTWDPVKTFGRALAALGALLQVVADLAIWMVVFGWLPIIAVTGLLLALRTRRPAAPSAPTA